MSASAAITAALLRALAAQDEPEAEAEDGPSYSWGLVARRADDDEFLTSRWAEVGGEIHVGSGESMDLVVEGVPAHAFDVAHDPSSNGWWVTPANGEVRVDGRVLGARAFVSHDATITCGGLKLGIVRLEPEEAEAEAEGEPAPPPLDPVEAGERAADARHAEFEKPAYHFCHDPEYGRDGTVGTDFCVIFDGSSDEVCPEAREHCEQWTEARGENRFVKQVKGSREAMRRGNKRARRSLVELPQLPPAVAYVVLGLLIAGVVLIFVRAVMGAGWEDEQPDLAEVQLDDAARNLRALPEAKVPSLLRLAERALERDDPAEAAILLHLAILRFLDDEGVARYHPSKTNGDYLRAIRPLKPLAKLLRRVATQTERVRFGDGRVEAAAIPELLAEARQLLVKGTTLPGIAGPAGAAGPALFLLALIFGGQACSGGPDGSKPFHEYGPSGLSALPDLLEEAGLSVRIGRERFVDVPPGVGTVVIRTSASGEKGWPGELKVDSLLDRGLAVVVIDDLGKAPTLLPVTATVSAGKPRAETLQVYADPDVACIDALVGLDELAGLDPVRLPSGFRLRRVESVLTASAAVTQSPLELFAFLAYEGDLEESWLSSAGVALAGVRVDPHADEYLPGCLWFFADRDLFTNASLTRAANARFVAQFFARITAGRQVLLLDRLDRWVTSSGDGDEDEPPDPSRALEASNMLPFLLQAFATLGLLYLFLGAAFGRLRDPVHVTHKSFVEHVEALGRHYAASGKAGLTHSAQSLAKLVVMRSRELVRSGQGGGWSGLASDLARKYELPEEDVRAALRLGIEGLSDLGAPRPEDPEPSSERMLRTLSRLLGGTQERRGRA